MEPLLFLTHRIPYPPNKGDKIRSFHLLRHLASRYRVFLGTFVDSDDDLHHVDKLAEWCAGYRAVRIHPKAARLRSLPGLLRGEALTLPYYRNAELRHWVRATVAAENIRKALVFCSSMAQYVDHLAQLRVVADFVDVDSAKWVQYANERTWPSSWIFRREGERLLAHERAVARQAAATVLVTWAEVELFLSLAPECAGKVCAVENGVDAEFFAPDPARPSPYAAGETAIVFTGAMDYWPNIDAVVWFAQDVLPALRARRGDVRFYVVGMNPAPAVRALGADAGVIVTGKVADVRPYVQHAAAVVAPLRVARGVQNKVLEAMALARPVVVSTAAARGIAGTPGRDFEAANQPSEYIEKLLRVLDPATGAAIGAAARACVQTSYDWQNKLAAFTHLLDAGPGGALAGRAAEAGP